MQAWSISLGLVPWPKESFKVIGVEVYPMNTDEYALLHESGYKVCNDFPRNL